MRRISGYSLWVGHACDARDPRGLFAVGIGAVLDLAGDEPPAVLPRGFTCFRIPIVDGGVNPPWLLALAVETAAKLLEYGMPTLVACGAGMSRAPAVAGLAIARVEGLAPVEGLSRVAREGPADVHPALWADLLSAIAPTESTPKA